ncbi:MAG: diphthine--ammonia ligase [Thermoplasmatales archaeon]|nr:diphthine--ammonia ligase [Thermoplasmatales archaeon]
MNVGCLVSGGKDSIYAMYIAMNYGWNIKCLITIKARNFSWMYHVENIDIIPFISKSTGIPLIFEKGSGDEIDDLRRAIKKANVEGIVYGAIESEYQKTRIEKVAEELNIKSFAPLWGKNQENLLHEIINAGFSCVVVATAAEGMDERFLGRAIDERFIDELRKLSTKYGVNISGEGGEYETLVVDCPIYRYRIEIVDAEIKSFGDKKVYEIKKIRLQKKYNCI